MTQKQIPNDNDNGMATLEELIPVPDFLDQDKEYASTERCQISDIRCPSNPIDIFSNPNLAFLLLDTNLSIVFFTPKTAMLFKDYYVIELRSFFSIFHDSFEANDVRNLLSALKSYEKGYSWTGTLKHKTPKAKTLQTRTTIIPFFSIEKKIAGFQVYFENITAVYFSQIHATFKSILEAAKLKDNDTGMHDERVSHYSKRMAEYLYTLHAYPQIDPDFIENIGFLAAMHDVGKIGTPDYILQKPGKLTEQEWEIMREHTINGTFILSSYPVSMAKEIALSHHEWWNGDGYPYNLEGEMIPLSARIVTIADVYDALRMKRTYKSEFTHQETVQRILAGSGTQFDPELIKVFERINTDFDDIWNLHKDTDILVRVERDRSKEFARGLSPNQEKRVLGS